MRLLCRVGLHDWSKWTMYLADKIVVYEGKKVAVTDITVQLRECGVCGRKQVRSLRI